MSSCLVFFLFAFSSGRTLSCINHCRNIRWEAGGGLPVTVRMAWESSLGLNYTRSCEGLDALEAHVSPPRNADGNSSNIMQRASEWWRHDRHPSSSLLYHIAWVRDMGARRRGPSARAGRKRVGPHPKTCSLRWPFGS